MKVQQLLSLLDESKNYRSPFRVTDKNIFFIRQNISDVEDIEGNMIDHIEVGDEVRLTKKVANMLKEDEKEYFKNWYELFLQLVDKATKWIKAWLFREFPELLGKEVKTYFVDLGHVWKFILNIDGHEILICTKNVDEGEITKFLSVWHSDRHSPFQFRLVEYAGAVIHYYMHEYFYDLIEGLKTIEDAKEYFPELLEEIKKII